ncbi:MAG: hypothetical protein DSY60_00490 [Persephonella sp.]|nr:MAG: hypothetical protein DSY60_00490 [Persephonella sp.]
MPPHLKMVYLIYLLTIIIGIYVVYNNLPVLINIGIPDNQLKLGKFLVSLLPTVVGFFMIYFGISSFYSILNKNKR